MSKRALVTGAAGFIGHHLVEHLLQNTDWDVVGLVSFRHRGDSMRFQVRHDDIDSTLAEHPRFEIVYHDLLAPVSDQVGAAIGPVDYIFNVAAESHVDRSITEPVPFVRNNVDVALNMLEYARKAQPDVFLQVSTDEVYGAAPPGHAHREWEPILPSNPYSASKACQEAIAISYWRTYGVPVVITNTMNNFGERQHPEKFMPMVMRKITRGEPVPIHVRRIGVGCEPGSRFYLHARNHADALLFLSGRPPALYPAADRPDRWNVVGDVELSNLQMAYHIATAMGAGPVKYEMVDFHSSRPGHDPRYALDGRKIAEAGWTAPVPFLDSLHRTVQWTLAHPEWLS